MSMLIALIALVIIILALSFILLNQIKNKAHVENLIDPLAGFADSGTPGQNIINIYSGDGKSEDNAVDEDVELRILGLPNIYFEEDTIHDSLDLDNYAEDDYDALSELIWSVSGNSNITIIIDNDTHEVIFSAPVDWNGVESVTFTVEDTDGNTDSQDVLVTVNPVDDALVWNSLSNQNVDEDSVDGTIAYANITIEAVDPDDTVTITVSSTHTHFDLSISGNDLVISNLEANWYGVENVVLDANGETASFTLTVNHLMDDCIQICSWGTCYRYCD